jgi:hypothetical protein
MELIGPAGLVRPALAKDDCASSSEPLTVCGQKDSTA